MRVKLCDQGVGIYVCRGSCGAKKNEIRFQMRHFSSLSSFGGMKKTIPRHAMRHSVFRTQNPTFRRQFEISFEFDSYESVIYMHVYSQI